MWRSFWGLLGLASVAYLATGTTQILPGERAVVRRFGRVLDEQPRPGLWFGMPWGIDRIDRVAVHLIRGVEVGYPREVDAELNESPAGQLLTGDHNLVNVRVWVNYSVDESKIVEFVIHREQTDELVSRAGEAVLSEWAAGRTVDVVLVRGKAELPEILMRRLSQRLEPYHLGINVRSVTIDLLSPPEEVRPAFENVTRAQSGMRTQELEARQQSARRLREAEAIRFETEQKTAAAVLEKRLLAIADAERFERRLLEYERNRAKNPDYLTALWWEEMSALFSKMRTEGRVDLLDSRIAGDGLDVTLVPPGPGRK